MTRALIIVNVLVFPIAIALEIMHHEGFIMVWALVPKMVLSYQGTGAFSVVSSAFIHAGIVHLAGNMWFLSIFGPKIEDVCGPWRFLAFYLVCALTSGIVFTLVHPAATSPVVGASGAIFGLMGAYLILFPGSRMGLPLISKHFPRLPRIPAGLVVLFYLVMNLWSGINVIQTGEFSYTAYWGHLGGFFGALFVFAFLRSEVFARYLSDAKLVRQ